MTGKAKETDVIIRRIPKKNVDTGRYAGTKEIKIARNPHQDSIDDVPAVDSSGKP